MTKRKRQLISIIFRGVIIVSFMIIAAMLIIKASGLRINLRAKTVERTGIVIINTDPAGAIVYLNNHRRGETPLRMNYLPSAMYHFKIEKSGYKNWEKTITLEAGEYLKVEPVLFFDQPQTQEVINQGVVDSYQEIGRKISDFSQNDQLKFDLPSNVQDAMADKSGNIVLYRTDDEIWLAKPNKTENDSKKIVARFREPIKKVKFHPDFKHILYITDNQLSVIEITGTNQTLLMLTNDLDFKISPDGKKILTKDGEKYFETTIH